MRSAWTPERIAWLGFLVGLGRSAKEIATDPIIAATPGNVFRQAARFGLSIRQRRGVEVPLTPTEIATLDARASTLGFTRETFARKALLIAMAD